MAGDLIPPPSPAGRPAPDHEQPPAVAPEPPHAEPPAAIAAGSPGPSPFRARFGFLTGVLAGCGLAAAVLLVALLAGGSGGGGSSPAGDRDPAAGWSPWRPHTSGTIAGAQEIAKEIEGNYTVAKAKKLTKVKGGPIALGALPISVAIPGAGDRFTIVGGVGVQYTLAGFGKEGRLTDSEPSEERRRLLRREALELSLYSFRYLPEVRMVVALLPPAPKAEQFHPRKAAKAAKGEAFQRQAIFFQRGELREQVDRPLKVTMATEPPGVDALAGPEARRIDRLTFSNLFTYKHIQQQDGSIYLVLDRPS